MVCQRNNQSGKRFIRLQFQYSLKKIKTLMTWMSGASRRFSDGFNRTFNVTLTILCWWWIVIATHPNNEIYAHEDSNMESSLYEASDRPGSRSLRGSGGIDGRHHHDHRRDRYSILHRDDHRQQHHHHHLGHFSFREGATTTSSDKDNGTINNPFSRSQQLRQRCGSLVPQISTERLRHRAIKDLPPNDHDHHHHHHENMDFRHHSATNDSLSIIYSSDSGEHQEEIDNHRDNDAASNVMRSESNSDTDRLDVGTEENCLLVPS
jgi:hypothetical protein